MGAGVLGEADLGGTRCEAGLSEAKPVREMGGVTVQAGPCGRSEGRKEGEHIPTLVWCWGAQQGVRGPQAKGSWAGTHLWGTGLSQEPNTATTGCRPHVASKCKGDEF